MKVLEVVQVSDKKADKCMTVVEAADYQIKWNHANSEQLQQFTEFMSADTITTIKKTKSGEKLTDIRPMILSFEPAGDNSCRLRLSAGSRAHLNPQLLLDTFAGQYGKKLDVSVTRTEMYLLADGQYIPLSGVNKA